MALPLMWVFPTKTELEGTQARSLELRIGSVTSFVLSQDCQSSNATVSRDWQSWVTT